jgi:hypothetical protein
MPGRAKRTVPAWLSRTRWRQPTAVPGPGELVVARANALAIVVELADGRVRDVEGAARQHRELGRAHDEARHLGAHRHRPGTGALIDARQLRIGLVRAHGPVDAMHLVHHRGDRRLAGGALVAPQLDDDGRAHDRLFALEPSARRRRGAEPA